MGKILCYIYENMADFEIGLLIHYLRNIGQREIVTISEDTQMITAQSGMHYVADMRICDFKNVDKFEALVIPGGPIDNTQNAIGRIACEMINENKLVAAICFGPQFLGRAGILTDYAYTTSCTEETIHGLGCEDPFDRSTYQDKRVVRDRNLITAQGHAFVDFAEAVCAYLQVFEYQEQQQEHFAKIRGVIT